MVSLGTGFPWLSRSPMNSASIKSLMAVLISSTTFKRIRCKIYHQSEDYNIAVTCAINRYCRQICTLQILQKLYSKVRHELPCVYVGGTGCSNHTYPLLVCPRTAWIFGHWYTMQIHLMLSFSLDLTLIISPVLQKQVTVQTETEDILIPYTENILPSPLDNMMLHSNSNMAWLTSLYENLKLNTLSFLIRG